MTLIAPPPTTPSTSSSSSRPMGLRSNVLGFPTLLGQSIGLISPTMTAVLIIPLAFASAGQGTWLAYLFATIMLLFVVICINQFASRSASAGSMYTYIGRGLGPKAGVLSGWSLMWCYLFIGVAGLTGFSIFAGQFLSALGLGVTIPPVIFFLISAGFCWFVAYKDIHLSSLLTLFLEALSVTCILSLAFVVLFRHGISVDTSQLQLKGMTLHGLSLAVVACIFSLVGFESATALGGEARNPLRNVPKAVIWSLIITGAFMVFMAYVEVFGSRHAGTSLSSMAEPLSSLSRIYGVTAFRIPIDLGATFSFFSLSLTCLNAGARIMYPMARHEVLPAPLGRVHPRNQTPYVAITVFVLIMVAVPMVLEIVTNPLTSFGDAGTLAAFGFLLAYFMVSIAAPVYLRRRGELRSRYTVLAVIACVCLLVPTVGSFYPVPAFPVSIFPYLFAAYMVIGGVLLYAVNRRRRGIFGEIELDFERSLQAPLDEEEPDVSMGVDAPIGVATLQPAVAD